MTSLTCRPMRRFVADNKIPAEKEVVNLIADYFAAGVLTLGELIGCVFSRYPNITRWHGMKTQPKKVNAEFYGLRDAITAQPFVRI